MLPLSAPLGTSRARRLSTTQEAYTIEDRCPFRFRPAQRWLRRCRAVQQGSTAVGARSGRPTKRFWAGAFSRVPRLSCCPLVQRRKRRKRPAQLKQSSPTNLRPLQQGQAPPRRRCCRSSPTARAASGLHGSRSLSAASGMGEPQAAGASPTPRQAVADCNRGKAIAPPPLIGSQARTRHKKKPRLTPRLKDE